MLYFKKKKILHRIFILVLRKFILSNKIKQVTTKNPKRTAASKKIYS